jgi:hypothetical protein
MKPTQIIVITGDFNKGQTIWNHLKEHSYATTLVIGYGNISQGRLYGLDQEGEPCVYPVHRFGLALVDQITAAGFVPKWRSGVRLVSYLHLLMPCVAMGGNAATNQKLLNAGATYQIDDANALPFIENDLRNIAVRARRRKPIVKSLTGS